MIYSSSDIQRVLQSNALVSSMASVQVVNSRPPLEALEGVIVYVEKYATLDDFEATWKIWIIDYDGEPIDVLVTEIARVLPGFRISRVGGITEATTTELRTAQTEQRPQPAPASTEPVQVPQQQQVAYDFSEWEARFEALRESIEDRMLLVNSGRPGKDGARGPAGKDGKDGKDLVATDTKLGDLKDVETEDAKQGDFLSYDGSAWVPKAAPVILRYGKGGGGLDLPPGGSEPVALVWNPETQRWEPGVPPPVPVNFTDLADVAATGRIDKSVVVYDVATEKFVANNVNTILTITDGGNF